MRYQLNKLSESINLLKTVLFFYTTICMIRDYIFATGLFTIQTARPNQTESPYLFSFLSSIAFTNKAPIIFSSADFSMRLPN